MINLKNWYLETCTVIKKHPNSYFFHYLCDVLQSRLHKSELHMQQIRDHSDNVSKDDDSKQELVDEWM